MKKSFEQALHARISYIGGKIPNSLIDDERPKFVVLGYPQEVFDEIVNKSEHDLVMFIAEYSYKKANSIPLEKHVDVPSIVYEQVEKDIRKFLSAKTEGKK